MPSIATKDELFDLIYPSDPRYCSSGFLLDECLQDVWLLLQSGVITVTQREIPAKLPDKLPKTILANQTHLSQESQDELFCHLNQPERVKVENEAKNTFGLATR